MTNAGDLPEGFLLVGAEAARWGAARRYRLWLGCARRRAAKLLVRCVAGQLRGLGGIRGGLLARVAAGGGRRGGGSVLVLMRCTATQAMPAPAFCALGWLCRQAGGARKNHPRPLPLSHTAMATHAQLAWGCCLSPSRAQHAGPVADGRTLPPCSIMLPCCIDSPLRSIKYLSEEGQGWERLTWSREVQAVAGRRRHDRLNGQCATGLNSHPIAIQSPLLLDLRECGEKCLNANARPPD